MSAHRGDLKLGYVYAGLIIVIWSGFILVSRASGVSALTPYDVVAIRAGVAGLIVLPMWLRRGMPSIFNPRVAALCASGGLGYTLLTYSAFRLAPAAHGGVLLSGFQPFAMTLCALAVMGERPSRQRQVGIAIIALGGGLLGYGAFQGSDPAWAGDLMFVGASLCWSLYAVLARRWGVGAWDITINVGMLTALVYLPVYVIALPKGLAAASWGQIALQAAYQGALAAVIQMVIYMRAVEILGATRMGVLVALVPILAATAAVPVLGEPMTPLLVASLLLVSAGVYVGNAAPGLLAGRGKGG